MPECTVCHKTKPPRGRSVALEMANGMCSRDCEGYYLSPLPGHLWPNEPGDPAPGSAVNTEPKP
jgi:hypothetical protein